MSLRKVSVLLKNDADAQKKHAYGKNYHTKECKFHHYFVILWVQIYEILVNKRYNYNIF